MAELLSALFVVLVKGCTVVESRKLPIFPGGGRDLWRRETERGLNHLYDPCLASLSVSCVSFLEVRGETMNIQ